MPRLLPATLALLTGCAVSAYSGAGGLMGPTWTVESIAGEAPAGPRATTLRFEEGRLAGQGPCNRHGGSWRLEEGRLRISAFISTRMACPGPAMAQENTLLRLLERARAHQVSAGRLVIEGEDGARLVARRGG